MATFPKALSRTGVSQVNLVQYRAVKPNLHRIRFGERISTMRTAGNAAPSAPERQSTIGYDSATGRIATMLANGSNVPFAWSYLPGSDLKSSLAYPNGLTASWTYDANGQLLQVRNATPTDVISQYDYTYDAAGRRISCGKSGSAFTFNDTLSYGSNNRSELTNAVAAVDSAYRYAYDFDEIGNRETSVERGTNSVYTANNLNQYTAVDDFSPQFDDDGNQTLVKTATGIWSVTYNGENRPIYWTNGDTVITMSYDRMGRRNTKNGLSFVYNGYLQIANFGHSASIVESQVFIWNPMEPVATRPLTWSISTTQLVNSSSFYYVYDGNKNVSEVIKMDGDIAAHYEYAPFGSVVAQCGVFAPLNPWRFSCEYADDETAMVYYNYRHYEPAMGRWMSRDPVREFLDLVGAHVWFCLGQNSYSLVHNQPVFFVDALGLTLVWDTKPFPGSCPVELLPDVTYHFRSIDDDQDGIVRLRRETAEDLDVQMRVTAKRLCLYAKEDGKRSLIHEMTFDTKFFEGEYEQHQYYHIEGHEGIWADNEVNYIGIGMYEAWLGHSLDSAVTITALWKLRYLDSPSDGTCYWLAYGHTMFETYYEKLDPCTCEFKDGKDVDVDNYNRWRRRSR